MPNEPTLAPRQKTAFVSGHLDLTEEEFSTRYQPHIEELRAQGFAFVVGDAQGADLLFQRYAAAQGLAVTVFHMFEAPRNNAGGFAAVGGFTSDAARDQAMTAASEVDVAWVRTGREKSGTAKNLKRRTKP